MLAFVFLFVLAALPLGAVAAPPPALDAPGPPLEAPTAPGSVPHFKPLGLRFQPVAPKPLPKRQPEPRPEVVCQKATFESPMGRQTSFLIRMSWWNQDDINRLEYLVQKKCRAGRALQINIREGRTSETPGILAKMTDDKLRRVDCVEGALEDAMRLGPETLFGICKEADDDVAKVLERFANNPPIDPER